MIKHLPTLKTNPLFRNIPHDAILSLCSFLSATITSYQKHEVLLHTGDDLHEFGIILTGELHITKEDYMGNRSILTQVHAGDIFAEVFVCANITKSPVTIYAIQESCVLWLRYRITHNAIQQHPHYMQFMENLTALLAQKSLHLHKKIEYLSKSAIKERVLLYLYDQSKLAQSTTFTIPYNRQELADYLCVDRSALSSTLSKLKQQGILSYQKNQFQLKKIR